MSLHNNCLDQRGFGMFDQAEQFLSHLPPQLLRVLPQRGQRRLDMPCNADAVVARDRNVIAL